MWLFLLKFITGIRPVLSTIGDFIAKHWKGVCVVLMLGIIVYQNTQVTRWLLDINTIPHLNKVVAEQKVTIDQLNAALTTATKANATLTTSIGALNNDVLQWQTKSQELQSENAQMQTTINNVNKAYQTKINKIMSDPTPTTCQGSVDYLRQNIGGLQWPTK